MSSHDRSPHELALVPLEAWCYCAPELALQGKKIDVGLLCEALLYYDTVAVSVGNPDQFFAMLEWFQARESLEVFQSLLLDGTLIVHEYSFVSTAVLKNGTYSLWNIQGGNQGDPNTFVDRYLAPHILKRVIPGRRKQNKLRFALAESIIESKADDYGAAIKAAKKDAANPDRNALVLQAFVDELYVAKGLGDPPSVSATVRDLGAQQQISWGIDLDELSRLAGRNLGFHRATPLVAAAVANRFLLSASQLGCDLFLSSPMSRLVGDKLYEAAATAGRPHEILDSLEAAVEFPNVRDLINQDRISFEELLSLRAKAGKFRAWLQDEAERDRDALIAYHHEVARESGLFASARHSLNLFGVFGGPASAVYLETLGASAYGAVSAGAAVTLASTLASQLGTNWRPVVFGCWLSERIEELTAD